MHQKNSNQKNFSWHKNKWATTEYYSALYPYNASNHCFYSPFQFFFLFHSAKSFSYIGIIGQKWRKERERNHFVLLPFSFLHNFLMRHENKLKNVEGFESFVTMRSTVNDLEVTSLSHGWRSNLSEYARCIHLKWLIFMQTVTRTIKAFLPRREMRFFLEKGFLC